MKREKAIGMVGVVILIVFIAVCVFFIYNKVKNILSNVDSSDIKSNMLLIQGAGKLLNDNANLNNEKDKLIGTKLSEYVKTNEASNEESSDEETKQEDSSNEDEKSDENSNEEKNQEDISSEVSNEINDKIKTSVIEEFIEKNIIEKDYDKYYILTDEDLQKLNIDVKNEKNSYYIINYESSEVCLTKGVDGKYKLQDIE